MATERQKQAIDNMVENGGIASKAMIDAGYSENTAKTPSKLTESKAFREIFESAISDNDLAKRHKQFLNESEDSIGIKALDLAYKLKGSYAADKTDITTGGDKIGNSPELEMIATKMAEQLKDKKL